MFRLSALAELCSTCLSEASLFIKMKKPAAAFRHEYIPFGSLLCAGDERLVMYEYMPFGSLECHLFGEFFSISSMFESWFKPSYYHQFLGMLDM
jgi:hypothetical protein